MKLLKLFILLQLIVHKVQAINFTEWKVRLSGITTFSGTNRMLAFSQAKYGHNINSSTEAEASEAFNKTVASIKRHNMDPNRTYEQRIGEAAGMTEREKNVRTGYRSSKRNSTLPKFNVTLSKAPTFLNLTR